MRLVPDDVIVCDPKNPVTLVGEPGRVSGTVCIRNDHDKRVVINRGVLRYRLPPGAKKGEAEEIESRVSVMAIVGPGQSIDAPISARLRSSMPPGMHDAMLVLGTSSYPVQILVTESIDVEIAPSRIFIANGNGAGGRVRKQVIASNWSNIPVTAGCFGAVPLDHDLAWCSIVRGTLKNAPAGCESINQWATRYLRKAGEHLEQVGALWVDTEGGPVIIEPGDSVPLTLMIRVPPQLPTGRHVGVVKWYDLDFEIVVVPTNIDKNVAAGRGAGAKVKRSK